MKVTVSELEISAEELRANRTLSDVIIQSIIGAFDRFNTHNECEDDAESEDDE